MTHLSCDIHMWDNIQSKLCAFDLSQDARTKILNKGQFGRHVSEAKVKGLIDTETDSRHIRKELSTVDVAVNIKRNKIAFILNINFV